VPVYSADGSGTIKFDLDGERLEISADNEVKPMSNPPVTVRAAGTLAFDPKAGYIGIKALGSARGSDPGMKGRIEYCVTVSFPKGLMPPAQMFEQNLDMYKPMIKQQLDALPSTEVTIDGEKVEIIKVDDLYCGLRPNAAPFGAGITAPKGGTWNPVLKFPTWQHGAGSIEEFSCTDMPEASTSAAELVADPEASKTLKVFEELLTSLHGIQPLNKAFGAVPARPLTIFHDAAAKEMITKATSMNNSQQQWPSVALAGAAGALGGVAMLFALLKLTARRSSRTEPLLEQFA